VAIEKKKKEKRKKESSAVKQNTSGHYRGRRYNKLEFIFRIITLAAHTARHRNAMQRIHGSAPRVNELYVIITRADDNAADDPDRL